MRGLTITNKSVTREALLEMAEETPRAWTGIRFAALLLLLEGWKSSQIARMFGLNRWSVVRWIQRANEKRVSGIAEKKQPGRPGRLDEQIQRALETDLEKSPRGLGLKRNRWDEVVVVEYLERIHGIGMKVRQAQQWIRRLGFSLRQPIYRYAQATTEGVAAIPRYSTIGKDGKHGWGTYPQLSMSGGSMQGRLQRDRAFRVHY